MNTLIRQWNIAIEKGDDYVKKQGCEAVMYCHIMMNNGFGSMKGALTNKRHRGDKEMKTTVINWRHQQLAEFYEAGIHALTPWRNRR